MKSKGFLIKTIVCSATLLALATTQAVFAGGILYSNLDTPAGTFSASGSEIGDEVILADNGNGSTIDSFTFSFYNTAPDGVASLTVFLYANNGVASPSGPLSPNTTPLWSDNFALPNAPTGLNVDVSSDLPGGGLSVPSDFTWAVEFSGLGANDAGLILSTSAPTIGINYNDYWWNLGTTGSPSWITATNADYVINFLSTFGGTANPATPTPEPSSVALMGLGIAGLAGFLKRKANRA